LQSAFFGKHLSEFLVFLLSFARRAARFYVFFYAWFTQARFTYACFTECNFIGSATGHCRDCRSGCGPCSCGCALLDIGAAGGDAQGFA
jgi:hypothetical protein